MSDKRPSDDEMLARLEESWSRDVLGKPCRSEQVDRELRAEGVDPDELAKEGSAFVATLLNDRRLSWQVAARKRRDAWTSTYETVKQTLPRKNRIETLASLHAMRADPNLHEPIVTAFRKRQDKDASDDELHELLVEMETLRRVVSDKKDPDK